jgi:hypothetical protein
MLVGTNARKLFKIWKLSERKAFFGTIVSYQIQGVISMERYFKDGEEKKVYDLLRYLFREFEYHWQILYARQISYLLWCDHTTVDRTLERIKYQVRTWHLLLN